MSFLNTYTAGFVCVAACSVVGVDYMMQTKAAGSHPGAYSFTTYLGEYGLRVDDTLAHIDKTRRQSVEARMHLPMEPAGWDRVARDIGAIDMTELTRGMHVVQSMAAKKERSKATALAGALSDMGFEVSARPLTSRLHAISVGGTLLGGADPRREGLALGQ